MASTGWTIFVLLKSISWWKSRKLPATCSFFYIVIKRRVDRRLNKKFFGMRFEIVKKVKNRTGKTQKPFFWGKQHKKWHMFIQCVILFFYFPKFRKCPCYDLTFQFFLSTLESSLHRRQSTWIYITNGWTKIEKSTSEKNNFTTHYFQVEISRNDSTVSTSC